MPKELNSGFFVAFDHFLVRSCCEKMGICRTCYAGRFTTIFSCAARPCRLALQRLVPTLATQSLLRKPVIRAILAPQVFFKGFINLRRPFQKQRCVKQNLSRRPRVTFKKDMTFFSSELTMYKGNSIVTLT